MDRQEKIRNMVKKYHIREKIIFTILYLIFVGVMYIRGVGCVFLNIVGKPCPGCGMTRAWISVLRADFATAFALHPLFFTVPVLYLYILADGHLFTNKYVNSTILGLIFLLFFLLFVIRLFT